MDLLGGYGSSDEDEQHQSREPSPPPPSTSDKPQGQAASSQRSEPHPASGDASTSGNNKLWSAIPAPQLATKRVVQFQLPNHKALLEALKEDDDDVKPTKKAKTNPGKSKLLELLPPPKNDLPPPRVHSGLGGGGFAEGGKHGTTQAKQQQPIAALPAGFFEAGADGGAAAATALGNENEMYRVDADGAAGYAYPQAGTSYDMQYAYQQQQYAEQHAYAEPAGYDSNATHVLHQASGPEAGGLEIFEQALREEQARAARRGKGGDAAGLAGVQFKEVSQKQLTYMDPASKEAQDGVRNALGVEYALKLRQDAKSYEGSKMAKRKHQIGTLYFNAKMTELELLEQRGNSMKSKAETQAKYGW